MNDSVNEKPGRLLSARDLLIVVPIVGTILAVTYDVGFFWGLDISLFTLFSLPEHIVFALQTTPIAFFLALLVPAAIAGDLIGKRTGAAAVKRILGGTQSEESIEARIDMEMKRFRRTVIWAAIVLSIFALIMAVSGSYFFASVTGLAVLIGLGDAFLPERYQPFKWLPWSMSFCVFVMSFALGLQNAHDVWAQKSPTESIMLVGQTKGISGRLIRSGDRGLLFFDPGKKSISFILWNDVKGIQTLR